MKLYSFTELKHEIQLKVMNETRLSYEMLSEDADAQYNAEGEFIEYI